MTTLSAFFAAGADAATLTVTSSADDGGGSSLTLREAVDQANASASDDTIEFDLPEGDRTITLSGSSLPDVQSAETSGSLMIDDAGLVTVSGDDASRILSVSEGGDLTLEGLTLIRGGDLDGGAVLNRGGTLAVTGSTFSENDGGEGGGGAIDNDGGTLTITNSTFTENSAEFGGAIESSSTGTLIVTDSTFERNSSGNSGGAIRTENATLTVGNTTFTENTAANNGGAVDSSTADYPEGQDPPGQRTSVTNSTFYENTADASGGAVNNERGYTEIAFSTVTANVSPSGGGVTSHGLTATTGTRLTASIITGNTVPAGDANDLQSDGNRPFESGGANLTGEAGQRAADFDAPRDRTSVTATEAFGEEDTALEDNGGPTRTVALEPGALAVDNAGGVADFPSTDQRGVRRPVGEATDTGALEYDPAQTGGTLVVNSNADPGDGLCSISDCTLREAVNRANETTTDESITFDLPEGGRTISLQQKRLEPGSRSGALKIDGDRKVTISGSDLRNKSMFYIDGYSTVTLDGLTFTGGVTQHGGAVYSLGALTVTDSTFTDNSAYTGGAIYVDPYSSGATNISGSTFSGNSADYSGGAIFSSSVLLNTLTVSDSTFTDNSAGEYGGAVCGFYSKMAFTDSTFEGNSASEGGAIRTWTEYSSTTIEDSTFALNTASYQGGAVQNYDDATTQITNSTFTGNSASEGGAVQNEIGRVEITNSTLTGNTASDRGGAVQNRSEMTVSFSTLTANTSPFGAGTSQDSTGGSLTTLGNSIIVGNTDASGQPQDVSISAGTVQSDGFENLVGGGNGAILFPDNRNFTVEEAFGTPNATLEDNGGPTETIALEPGARAIDRLNPFFSGYPVTDQRGVARPKGSAVDSGAFEFDPMPPVVTTSEGQTRYDSDGGRPVAVDPRLTVTDPNDATLASATVQISGGFTQSDRLGYRNPGTGEGNIRGSYDAGAGVLTLTSEGQTATVEEFQRALRSVSYSSTADAPAKKGRTIAFTVSDGQNTSGTATKVVSIISDDAKPTISEIKDRTIRENTATARIKFKVGDADDEASSLKVSATSSNTKLVKRDGIKLSGSAENRTVRVVPEKNQTGSTRIILTVTDPDGLEDTTSFVLKVKGGR